MKRAGSLIHFVGFWRNKPKTQPHAGFVRPYSPECSEFNLTYTKIYPKL